MIPYFLYVEVHFLYRSEFQYKAMLDVKFQFQFSIFDF